MTHSFPSRRSSDLLTAEERERLDEYMRSDPGRVFVDSLNQEQVNRKWESVGEPLSGIEWLRDLRTADPAQATEIVVQAIKLYNQYEVRGGRLIAHLQDNESSAAQTRDWIGTEIGRAYVCTPAPKAHPV